MTDLPHITAANARRIREAWTKSDAHPAAAVFYDGLHVVRTEPHESVESAQRAVSAFNSNPDRGASTVAELATQQ